MTIRTEQIRRTVLAAAAILVLGSVAVAGGLTPEMMVGLKQVRQVRVAPEAQVQPSF